MIDLLFIQGETAETTVAVQTEAPAVRQAEVIEVESKNANAKDMQQTPPGGGWSFWVMIILMIGVLWLFMWRTESKRRKAMAKFREGLKKGDKIITAGGIYGTVKEVKEASLLIEVDSNVTLRIDKNMVVGDPSQAQQPAK